MKKSGGNALKQDLANLKRLLESRPSRPLG
jgi:hypothetical protein